MKMSHGGYCHRHQSFYFLLCLRQCRLSVRPSVTNVMNTIFHKGMNRFCTSGRTEQHETINFGPSSGVRRSKIKVPEAKAYSMKLKASDG